MKATDDGIWHECPEADYRALVRELAAEGGHRRGVTDDLSIGPMWFIYNDAAFARDERHSKSPSNHMICWRVRDRKDERMRFWVPTHWLMQRRGKNLPTTLRENKVNR